MFTAIGVLGALVERERSGAGQYLDVSMLDCQLALLEGAISRYFATGQEPGRIGTRHPLITPFQAFATADGHVVIANVKDWALFCALIERDELAADARFTSNERRTQHHAELEPLLAERLAQRTTAEWIEALGAACLVARLNTIAEAVAEPQALYRQMFADVPAPDGGTMRVVASPLKYSRTPLRIDQGADAPGGHTARVLRSELDMSDEDIARLAAGGVIGTPG
jgi:CoA:oxalate CoA-transferase